jgi:hypothetical protein
LFRPGAGRNGECHRQRESDDADHDAGEHIVADVAPRPQSGGLGIEQRNHSKLYSGFGADLSER